MYNNEKFIDLMDKINSVAKTKNFVNGVAWARDASEKQNINLYDYSAFENCHYLRNLMAHGNARDIQISEETLHVVQVFYQRICMPDPQEQKSAVSYIQKQEELRQSQVAQVKAGDYVIAIMQTTWYWDSFSEMPYDRNNRKNMRFTPGQVFRVVDEKMNLQHACRPSKIWGPQEVLKNCIGIYVFRTDKNFVERADALYTVNFPKTYKESGKWMIQFEYVQWAFGKRDQVSQTLSCEGYAGRMECFRQNNPMPLYIGPESLQEYLDK